MKEFLYICIVFLGLSFFVPQIVHGEDDENVGTITMPNIVSQMQNQNQAFAGEDGANLGNPSDIRVIVARIIKIFLGLVGTLMVIYTFYGGFLYMTSGGAEDRIEKGRKIIFYGVLGSLIVLMSYSLAWFAYYIAYKGVEQNPYGGFFNWGVSVGPDTSQFYQTDPLEQNTVPDQLQLENMLKGN
ncbi:MAG TPA: hypothetical protein DCS29_02010 [Candidatus Magasanikbacteria bacterium]|nr:MAG: hypothetical protein A2479_00325 [Candidatus Magasanikbacteria bacterium RIFOXYC2_FULL_39_8]HAT03532.1 hypothetical protein [Candidatus Magasanikbacteria bacterium]